MAATSSQRRSPPVGGLAGTKPRPAKCVLLGNSQTDNINPERFSERTHLTKVQVYTLQQANDWVNSTKVVPHKTAEFVAVYQIANDVKTDNVDRVVANMTMLVNSIKDRFESPKILISLATPRDDGLQDKVSQINTVIRELSRGDNQVKRCHHHNLADRGRANPRFYSSDRYHLNEIGTRMLAANLRYSLEGKHTIKDFQKHRVLNSQTTPYGSNQTCRSTDQSSTNTNANTAMIPPHKMIQLQYNCQSQFQNISQPQAPHRSSSQVYANNTMIPSQYNCQPQAPHVNEPLVQYGSHQQAL